MDQPELARLIITNLGDLDAAACCINNDLEPAINEAIDEVLKNFVRDKQWAGGRVAKSQTEIDWLAPKEWHRKGDYAGDDYCCRFEFGISVGKGDTKDFFWLTKLIGIGDRNVGLRWHRNGVNLKQWANAVGQQKEIIAALRSRGFDYEEKSGSFFLPTVVKQSELAQAVGDEFPGFALGPITAALETCFNAKSDFDDLLNATPGLN